MGIIHCQDNAPQLADLDVRHDGDLHMDHPIVDNYPKLAANDTHPPVASDGIVAPTGSTTTLTPEPFSCHECTNCNSKSDFTTRVCEQGITMCYVN